MANIDDILKDAESQIKALAEKLFKQYTNQAVSDSKNFLQRSKADLERWVKELAQGGIDKDEFRSLVQGQVEIAEMRALKQAGLAQVAIDTFTSGVVDILVSAALAAVKI